MITAMNFDLQRWYTRKNAHISDGLSIDAKGYQNLLSSLLAYVFSYLSFVEIYRITYYNMLIHCCAIERKFNWFSHSILISDSQPYVRARSTDIFSLNLSCISVPRRSPEASAKRPKQLAIAATGLYRPIHSNMSLEENSTKFYIGRIRSEIQSLRRPFCEPLWQETPLAVAVPCLELRWVGGGGGVVLLTWPAGLSSFCDFFFFTQIREGDGRGPPLVPLLPWGILLIELESTPFNTPYI